MLSAHVFVHGRVLRQNPDGSVDELVADIWDTADEPEAIFARGAVEITRSEAEEIARCRRGYRPRHPVTGIAE